VGTYWWVFGGADYRAAGKKEVAMPNWNRILVGDAFHVANWNRVRDIFLIWPLLVFTLAGVAKVWSPREPAERIVGYKCLVCAAVVLFLMKERRYTVLGLSAYIGLKLGIASIFYKDWHFLLAFLVLAALAALIFYRIRADRYRPHYQISRKMYAIDLVAGISGLVMTFLIVQWLRS
jgi:hypothetical protein